MGIEATGFWKQSRETPDRPAIIEQSGRTITYSSLRADVNRLAHGLLAAGLDPGDAVAVVMGNRIEYMTTYLAAIEAGLYFTPVNFHLTAPEITYVLQNSDASMVVTEASMAGLVADSLEGGLRDVPRFSADSATPGFPPLSDLIETMPDDELAPVPLGEVMVYTSGTTGQPKGVKRDLGRGDVLATLDLFSELLVGGRGDGVRPHIVSCPLYHRGPFIAAAVAVHIGHPIVVMDRWTPLGWLELVQEHAAATAYMVPTMLHRLGQLDPDVRSAYDVSSLNHVLHSAAPIAPADKREMISWLGPILFETYGGTEGGGTRVTSQEWLERPGTVGRAWPGAEVRVLDPDGGVCPPGVEGTVYIRPTSPTFSYHKDPEKTATAKSGELHTIGDLGWLDDEGYLFLLGRRTDMIISGGVNIYPVEIENVLLESPDVADAAVFGVPDDDRGEQILALVVLNPGVDEQAAAGSLIDHCSARLAKYKVPRMIEVRSELPRTSAGKLYKRRLQDEYWPSRATGSGPDRS